VGRQLLLLRMATAPAAREPQSAHARAHQHSGVSFLHPKRSEEGRRAAEVEVGRLLLPLR